MPRAKAADGVSGVRAIEGRTFEFENRVLSGLSLLATKLDRVVALLEAVANDGPVLPNAVTIPVPPHAAAPVASASSIGSELAEAMGSTFVRQVLGRELYDRVMALGDETKDPDVAVAVRYRAVDLLGTDGFAEARDRHGFKGRLPTGCELRRFVLEELGKDRS